MTTITMTTEALTAAIAAALAQNEAHKSEKKLQEVYVDPDYIHLIGKPVFIRTVTMTNVGILQAITPNTFILGPNSVWIANSGPWNKFCSEGVAEDFEHFGPYPVNVAKAAVIDAGEMPKVPKKK